MAKTFESGEYDSSSWRIATAVGESGPELQPAQQTEPEPPPSNLAIALRYWPGRWPYAVVAGFLVTEPFLRELSPEEWTEMLDQRTAILLASGLLVDFRTFP